MDTITTVFQNLETGNNWSLQLLNIKNSKHTGTGYSTRQISLSPRKLLNNLLSDIVDVYTGNGKNSLKAFNSVQQYDGTTNSRIIYKLSTTENLISTEYKDFAQSVANPNTDDDPFQYTSAYLLKGQIILGTDPTPVKLISMRNPTTTLRHKFLHNKGTFEELSDKVLSLRPAIDVLIVGQSVYFLTLAGENLFNMARAYKAVCKQKVEDIARLDIIHGIETFKSVAESGHNPRRFISFNEKKLHALKNKRTRVAMAKHFSIPLDSSGDKFDATKDGTAEKIVKLLCNKGMLDPFEKTAVEVDGARKWS